jgi:hypothetical protein
LTAEVHPNKRQGVVLYLTAEVHPNKHLKPRFKNHAANMRNIHLLSRCTLEENEAEMAAHVRRPKPVLVIIDLLIALNRSCMKCTRRMALFTTL